MLRKPAAAPASARQAEDMRQVFTRFHLHTCVLLDARAVVRRWNYFAISSNFAIFVIFDRNAKNREKTVKLRTAHDRSRIAPARYSRARSRIAKNTGVQALK